MPELSRSRYDFCCLNAAKRLLNAREKTDHLGTASATAPTVMVGFLP